MKVLFMPNTIKVATWNINNRVGYMPFRLAASDAVMHLDTDVIVLTEYFPKDRRNEFERKFTDRDWHVKSSDTAGDIANTIFIASKCLTTHVDIEMPSFDKQFPSNILCVRIQELDLLIVGVRVPWYTGNTLNLVNHAWDWLESLARTLSGSKAIILGDFNVGLRSGKSRGGDHFRRILNSGWHRANPKDGASFIGASGKTSEIDHVIGTAQVSFANSQYIVQQDCYTYAGEPGAISDHAALMADVTC